jgi:hypothetical protein
VPNGDRQGGSGIGRYLRKHPFPPDLQDAASRQGVVGGVGGVGGTASASTAIDCSALCRVENTRPIVRNVVDLPTARAPWLPENRRRLSNGYF